MPPPSGKSFLSLQIDKYVVCEKHILS